MRMILITLIFNLIKMTLNRMTLMQHKFLDLRYAVGGMGCQWLDVCISRESPAPYRRGVL